MVLNSICYSLNSYALGDVIATAPVIKWMIDHYHHKTDTYIVTAKQVFRPILHFVPDDKFRDFDKPWGLTNKEAVALLNTKANGKIIRNTPKHMNLSQFASIKLTDRIIPLEQLDYVPLIEVDVSKFNIDFSKSVILISSYRDKTRCWHADYMLETAEYIKSKGYTPVFIGKTDKDLAEHLKTESSLPDNIDNFGIDLRNKTTIPELATIIGKAKVVCGIDSGPIHLAGTTKTPIICGYTSVDPKYRIPNRKIGKTYPICPDIPCISCESKWLAHFWNFESCYLEHINCCKQFMADRFIFYLKDILN